jgi:hypothetical protein
VCTFFVDNVVLKLVIGFIVIRVEVVSAFVDDCIVDNAVVKLVIGFIVIRVEVVSASVNDRMIINCNTINLNDRIDFQNS